MKETPYATARPGLFSIFATLDGGVFVQAGKSGDDTPGCIGNGGERACSPET